MPAKPSISALLSHITRRKLAVGIVAAIALAGLAVWAHSSRIAAPTTNTTITPTMRLAVGTMKLDGTADALDADSAAKLLPLWQLLEQVETSDASAPQEVAAVIEEIRLNMTPAQIKAIDAMSLDNIEPTSNNTGSTISTGKSTAQAAAPAGGPDMGMMMGGGAPMDGGGPMPGSVSSQSTTSTKTSSSSASVVAIDEVIRLLESKLQS